MNGKVCSKCQVEMRMAHSGVLAAEMTIQGPMALWQCDEWECLECGITALLGWALKPWIAAGPPDELERQLAAWKAGDGRNEPSRNQVRRFWLNARERDEWVLAQSATGRPIEL